MVYEAESVLVSFQHHTGVPWVAVIQENPMKIFSHRVKMGALWSYYCWGQFLGGIFWFS